MNTERKSFWQLEDMPRFKPLQGDTQADAVIVGAGMSGLLCAYLLYRKGFEDIVIIDAAEVLSGVTAYTTAKITSQHGLIYSRLMKGFGEDMAAQYLGANEKAVGLFSEIISREKIDCDFTVCNAWVYATSGHEVQPIEDEVAAAKRLGMNAELSRKTELPFTVEAAVAFPGQAHFHPLKFARHICGLLTENGCKIYTETKATGLKEGVVQTDRGNIRAKHVISCSRYPFIDKALLIFTKIYQDRSYVLALQNAGTIRDMYLDCKKGGLSFRPQGDALILGAYDHKTGHDDKNLHFDGLIKKAGEYYPGGQIVCMWSAQDCMTHDKIPYIGRLESHKENVYIATGFNKWGMSGSMAAADVISDLIVKGESEYQDVFSLKRKDLGLQSKSFIKESVDIAGNFLTHLTAADKSLQDLKDGEGGIVQINQKRVGVYKDGDGRIFPVKPMCTHMGCALKWNKDENTWDCTCHGSRYDYEGNVIGGPALLKLERPQID
ncbi:MAG: FAD-dependent oxidoreductase [Oscillospiraceae bacterium]|nr:FAD-dependent oxidoreductase [Oscillospiraceae bacterium]